MKQLLEIITSPNFAVKIAHVTTLAKLTQQLKPVLHIVWLVSIFPPWKVIGNSLGVGGGGVLQIQLLEETYEAKLEIPGG